MSGLQVDLNAYVLPEDHVVWKCHPGKTYRFYQVVKDAEAVFLDIRGLNELEDDPALWNDSETLKLIAADRWSRELHRVRYDGKAKGSPAVSKIDRRNLTYLKGLLLEAKKGDLILIPAEGWRKEVLVGEFLDEPGDLIKHDARDEEATHTYIGRRVRWRAKQEKRHFSIDVIKMLHTQTAFFAMPKAVREEIYRLAYVNFMIGNVFSATFSTTKEQFATSDSAVVGMWFNALSAVRDAIESGESIDGVSYLDLGLLRSENPSEGELAININSPGEYVLRSLGPFALAVMGLFPLMQVNAQDLVDQDINVTMHTVGAADKNCALKVEKAMKDMVETLSVTRLQVACSVGKRAATEATMHTGARLKSRQKGTN